MLKKTKFLGGFDGSESDRTFFEKKVLRFEKNGLSCRRFLNGDGWSKRGQ